MKKFILDDNNLWSNNALTDRPQTLSEKIDESRQALRLAADMSREYYHKPLIITYSGGKDSDVMLHLAETTLNPSEFEVLNSHTTVDAPETVYHIRDTFDRLKRHGIKTSIDYHIGEDGKSTTMWNLIPRKLMPPTIFVRYCCEILKEVGAPNRLVSVGVREDESQKRKGRNLFSIYGNTKKDAKYFSLSHADEVFDEAKTIQDEAWDCTLIKNMKRQNKTIVNPIYHWTNEDIWNFLNSSGVKTNPLYECGYKRVGCIGCPLANRNHRLKEFSDYPRYKEAYIKTFDRMLIQRRLKGKMDNNEGFHNWQTGQDVFDWWIEEYKYNVKGQITIDEYLSNK